MTCVSFFQIKKKTHFIIFLNFTKFMINTRTGITLWCY